VNSNDRIALELGRAQIGRLIAETQLEAAQATAKALEARVAELTLHATPCQRTPREVEDILRERGKGETVCPDDGLRPGEHSWGSDAPPPPDPS
jgi:hypothetical protein